MSKQHFSIKRMQAAWANGAKSKGPVTEEGKAKIRFNALQHGLTAKLVLLPNEDPDVLDQLAQSHLDIYEPADDQEFLLLEEVVANIWRIRRCWEAEGLLHREEQLRQRKAVEAEFKNAGADMVYARALRHLNDDSRALSNVQRQEVRYTRAANQARDRLLAIQAVRKAREAREAVENQPTPENPPVQTPAATNPINNIAAENTNFQSEPDARIFSPQTGQSQQAPPTEESR